MFLFQKLNPLLITIYLVLLVLTGCVSKSFNLKLYKLHTSFHEGQKLEVFTFEQLSRHSNETIPMALRSEKNPMEYFRLHDKNSTYEENLLHLMSGSLTPPGARVSREISSSCPVNWVIDFQSTRYPPHIWKAVCNGQGTTCLSSHSPHSICEEFSVSWLVLRFLGMKPNGHQIWQWQRESVPIGCSCSDL